MLVIYVVVRMIPSKQTMTIGHERSLVLLKRLDKGLAQC